MSLFYNIPFLPTPGRKALKGTVQYELPWVSRRLAWTAAVKGTGIALLFLFVEIFKISDFWLKVRLVSVKPGVVQCDPFSSVKRMRGRCVRRRLCRRRSLCREIGCILVLFFAPGLGLDRLPRSQRKHHRKNKTCTFRLSSSIFHNQFLSTFNPPGIIFDYT